MPETASASTAPPAVVVDQHDPFPEKSWLWRRLLMFAQLVVILSLVAYVTMAYVTLGRLAVTSDRVIAVAAITALGKITSQLLLVLLVNITIYLLAPSAEQFLNALVKLAAFKIPGFTINTASTASAAGGSTASTATTAGQGATPATAQPPAATPPTGGTSVVKPGGSVAPE